MNVAFSPTDMPPRTCSNAAWRTNTRYQFAVNYNRKRLAHIEAKVTERELQDEPDRS